MSSPPLTFEQVIALARRLPLRDKLRLIERLAPEIERELPSSTTQRSLLGLCADLGPAPAAETIDAARHEAWSSFPREDV